MLRFTRGLEFFNSTLIYRNSSFCFFYYLGKSTVVFFIIAIVAIEALVFRIGKKGIEKDKFTKPEWMKVIRKIIFTENLPTMKTKNINQDRNEINYSHIDANELLEKEPNEIEEKYY